MKLLPREINDAVNDWRLIRENSRSFVRHLGDVGLTKHLSRPDLDTFAKHFEEMLQVQKCYLSGIETGRMDFSDVCENHDFLGTKTARGILDEMTRLDQELDAILNRIDPHQAIEWPGEGTKGIASHISNLSIHEAFHLGQLVALSYSATYPLPPEVVESWALSPTM